MKKLKIILFSILLLFTVFVIICFIAICATSSETYLDGKTYESIEALHSDLVYEIKMHGEGTTDYFPRELSFYLKIEDKWFVFCEYSSFPDGTIRDDALYVYVVKENNGFVLETPKLGCGQWAKLPLHQDYEHWSYGGHFLECELNGKKQSVGFAFKNIDETKKVYFDDEKMSEIQVDSCTIAEPFILCYATSSKTYNLVEKLFIDSEDQHSLKID